MDAFASGPEAPATPATPEPMLEFASSRQLLSWMSEQRLSIALTTYQIGKLFVIGLKPGASCRCSSAASTAAWACARPAAAST
jgi:hypothetical protein